MVLDRVVAAPANSIWHHSTLVLVKNIALFMAGFLCAVRHVALGNHTRGRVECLNISFRNGDHELTWIVIELLAVISQALDAILETNHLLDN